MFKNQDGTYIHLLIRLVGVHNSYLPLCLLLSATLFPWMYLIFCSLLVSWFFQLLCSRFVPRICLVMLTAAGKTRLCGPLRILKCNEQECTMYKVLAPDQCIHYWSFVYIIFYQIWILSDSIFLKTKQACLYGLSVSSLSTWT